MEINKLTDAIILAAQKHEGQTRKDGTPYIYHPMRVAEMVKEQGLGIEYQVVALLHDLLEDTDATEEDIRPFGEDVLEAVKLLTRGEGQDEEEYVQKILENEIAFAVKTADKIDNLYDAAFTETDRRFCKRYAKTAEKYYWGKFSPALDDAILFTCNMSSKAHPQKEIGPLRAKEEEFVSYAETAKRTYEEEKDWYFRQINHPDFSRKDMRYTCEYDRVYKCFCPSDSPNFKYRVWRLCPRGWATIKDYPYDAHEYGDDIDEVTREDVVKVIKSRIESGYFYDFVDTSRL